MFCTRAPLCMLPTVPAKCVTACCVIRRFTIEHRLPSPRVAAAQDWWLARGAAAGALRCARGAGCDRIAWLCERAAVLVRGAACDACGLFCTRPALLLHDTYRLNFFKKKYVALHTRLVVGVWGSARCAPIIL